MNDDETYKAIEHIARDFRISHKELEERLRPILADIYKQGLETALDEVTLGYKKNKIWEQIRVTIRSKYEL